MNSQALSGLIIARIDFSKRAERDLKKIDPNIRDSAEEAFAALMHPPDRRPYWLRFHRHHSGSENMYTMHVTHNGDYKASLYINGNHAFINRVGTHNEIDDSPE